MTVTLEWSQLWAIFEQAEDTTKQDIFTQLELDIFIPRLSVQYQIEVLKSAPIEIVAVLRSLLKPGTLIGLKARIESHKPKAITRLVRGY